MSKQIEMQSFVSSEMNKILMLILNFYFTELGSSFANHLSKSLDVHGGVWPEVSGMSPTNERKRTFSLTNSIANSFGGGSGSGSGAPPTEKECRQVFFDCAL